MEPPKPRGSSALSPRGALRAAVEAANGKCSSVGVKGKSAAIGAVEADFGGFRLDLNFDTLRRR